MRGFARSCALLVVLAGCAGEPESQMQLLLDKHVAQTPKGMTPVYCYRTLAEYECFLSPLPDDGRQPIWTYLAAPG